MTRAFPQALFRTAVTALTALMGFYLGCLAYRLVAQLLYYVSVMTLIVVHIFGVDSKILQVLAFVTGKARESQPAMFAAGVIAFGLALWLVPRALRSGRRALRGVVMAGIPLLFVAAAGADLYYNVTPLSDIAFGPATYNARNRPVERRWAVEEIAYGTGVSGTFSETEGVLEYQPRMKRFILRGATGEGPTVNVFFFKGRRTPFSDVSADGKPRYYDAMQPFIGQKVRVLGTCWTGQIDADIADVRLAE